MGLIQLCFLADHLSIPDHRQYMSDPNPIDGCSFQATDTLLKGTKLHRSSITRPTSCAFS